MMRPKHKPAKQISKPKSRSLWPSKPRKETFERSGNFKFASPPASWPDCATAQGAVRKNIASTEEALKNKSPAAAETLSRELHPFDQALLSQVCIYDPPEDSLGHTGPDGH